MADLHWEQMTGESSVKAGSKWQNTTKNECGGNLEE
jgi:hypothetical protein